MPANPPLAPAKMRIALLADENQAGLLRQMLTAAAYLCHSFTKPQQLMQHLRRDGCDLLVLDWQVLDAGREDILAWVKEHLEPAPPMLLMTLSDDDGNNIAAGIDGGADDYIVKPIRRSELVMRVGVLLTRAYPMQHLSELIQFGCYGFETRARRASMNDHAIELTQKEFELAVLLFRNAGRPLSRAYILDAIWGRDDDLSSRTLDTHISRVRNKLVLRPEHGFRLATVYGYGYLLEQVAGDAA